MSWFSDVKLSPPIDVLALSKRCLEDTFEKKIFLGIGVFRTDDGKPWVLPAVRAAERALANNDTFNKEYLPILGLEEFNNAVTKMLIGHDSPAIVENRAFGIQTLSGTGALRIGAEFLRHVLGKKIFYYSNPTWDNHKLIFTSAGFLEGRQYRYWSQKNHGLDFDGFISDLRNAPEHSVIILHGCAHNPTGCDPTQEQWTEIARVMRENKLFPFFDSAFLGIASGDLNKDASNIRYFVQQGFELFCAQSFAKNFGLYNERVGNLTVILNNPEVVSVVKSQFSLIIRGMYSNPPSHGASIVSYILGNPELYKQWQENLQTMSARFVAMRKLLRDALEHLGTPGDWSHIIQHIGMFTYTGLNEIQTEHMVSKYHIYMLRRISMCGLTTSNVEYVAKAIHETITSLPD